jgi:alpha,alpha-trehalase
MGETENNDFKRVHDYISSSWKRAIHPSGEQGPHIIPLPFPFVPPAKGGTFRQMYYWDTFFTNRGLILDGRTDLATSNVENLFYLLGKFGYVPNANLDWLAKTNSQPPYLFLMVKDIYRISKNDSWRKKAYSYLKREYSFWMKKRMTPIGLNRAYHCPLTNEELLIYYNDNIGPRLNLGPLSDEEKIIYADRMIASAELGEDFTPRFRTRGSCFVPVDLNSLLYGMENYLGDLAHNYAPKEEKRFRKAMIKRKALMEQYLLGEDGLFYDYDFEKGERSSFMHSQQMNPFIFGLSNNKDALTKLLKVLLQKHGISVTAPYLSNVRYQSGYPYLWARESERAYDACHLFGMDEEANTIGLRFLKTVSDVFKKTNGLWETYDAVKGGIAEEKEYPTEEMLGWTAGTYEYLYEAILNHNNPFLDY